MAIYYRCPACKGEHRLMLVQTDSRSTFETMSFEGNSEPCPKTGKQVVVNKTLLFWKVEPEKKR